MLWEIPREMQRGMPSVLTSGRRCLPWMASTPWKPKVLPLSCWRVQMEFLGPFSPSPTTGTGRTSLPGHRLLLEMVYGYGCQRQGESGPPRLVREWSGGSHKDPDLNPVQITLPGERRYRGQEIEIRIKLREEDVSPNLRSVVSSFRSWSRWPQGGVKTKATWAIG